MLKKVDKQLFIKILVWASRIIFGAAFIFAGFTKAIDPLGSAYKIEDYLLAFGMEWMFSYALPLAVLLNTLEFVVGIAILLGLKMKITAWAGLLFMVFFTPLTLYIAITDPVPHCGCFGDAWIMTNWETFFKNIILLAAAIVIFIKKDKIPPLCSSKKDWWLIGVSAILVLWLSIYCLRNLPVIDFRPWKAGNDVKELVTPTEEVTEIYLIFENKETGERKEYPANDYPWDDPEWVEKWEYIDQKRKIIQSYQKAAISDFEVVDSFGEDFTDVILGNPDYHFLVIAYNLHTTNTDAFTEKINDFATNARENGYSLIVLAGSSFDHINNFRRKYQTPFLFFQSDPIELKTIIRSNPGLVLMKDGVVLGKWHYRNIPAYKEIEEKHIAE